jgi:hypothetical protein
MLYSVLLTFLLATAAALSRALSLSLLGIVALLLLVLLDIVLVPLAAVGFTSLAAGLREPYSAAAVLFGAAAVPVLLLLLLLLLLLVPLPGIASVLTVALLLAVAAAGLPPEHVCIHARNTPVRLQRE